jgi:hypothetical protein
VLALANARLSSQLRPQVVQLRPVDVADRLHLDPFDLRRVHGEGALDADAEGLLADGERLPNARALTLDDDPLEDLDTAALPLDHLKVHAHRIAGLELRYVGAQLALLE